MSKDRPSNITQSATLEAVSPGRSPEYKNLFREHVQKLIIRQSDPKHFDPRHFSCKYDMPYLCDDTVQIIMEELQSRPNIEVLTLPWGNGDRGIKSLTNALPSSHLTGLVAYGSYLTTKTVISLASVLPDSHLTYLHLGNNEIGNEGVASIAEALPNSHLTYLNVNTTKIDYRGAASIAEVLPNSPLKELFLLNNNIGDNGTIAIANALPNSRLELLNLRFNNISDNGAMAILTALDQNKTLKDIYLDDNNISASLIKQIEAKVAANHRISRESDIPLTSSIPAAGSTTIETVQPQSRVSCVEQTDGKIRVSNERRQVG